MAQVFNDYPEALRNTLRIAERVQRHDPERRRTTCRSSTCPTGFTLDDYFEHVAREGFAERAVAAAAAGRRGQAAPLDRRVRAAARLRDRDDQADGVPGLFPDRLGLHPLRARAGHSGRARAAARRPAAWSPGALRITDVDPLHFDLLFERFLNPERVSLPDIDVDFCERRRGEVIEYVTRKYGRENVSQIITFGTMKAKAVVRDVGRAHGHALRRRRSHRQADPGRRST